VAFELLQILAFLVGLGFELRFRRRLALFRLEFDFLQANACMILGVALDLAGPPPGSGEEAARHAAHDDNSRDGGGGDQNDENGLQHEASPVTEKHPMKRCGGGAKPAGYGTPLPERHGGGMK
jgi:hypothetical protein